MRDYSLLCSLNHEAAEAVVMEVVTLFENRFPGRVRAYYLFGSHKSGTALSNSDIDIAAVFKSNFVSELEREDVKLAIKECSSSSSIELDLTTPEENSLFEGGNATLKLDSVLLYGEDIRENLRLPEIKHWIRDRMHDGFGYIDSLRISASGAAPEALVYPLDYPNPTGEFYGYDARNMKNFAITIGWCASAILAFKLQTHVFRKTDCLELYRTRISDKWTSLIEATFERVRSEWNYQIPKEHRKRQNLQKICEQALGFENHFLLIYRDFLLDDVSSEGETRQVAVDRLRGIFKDDSRVTETLQSFEDPPDEHH